MVKEKNHTKTEDKKKMKAEIKKYQNVLTQQQLKIKEEKLPVIILVEGWAAAGKGKVINDLISELDPRFYKVFSQDSAREDGRPFLYHFFNAIPENGKFLIMDSGWMEKAVKDRVEGHSDKDKYRADIRSTNMFERTLKNNGYEIIKLFADISEKEQKERFEKLASNKNTAWRITESDVKQNRRYDVYRELYSDFMRKTSDEFPWIILDGKNTDELLQGAFAAVTERVNEALKRGKYNAPAYDESFETLTMPKLEEVGLNRALSKSEYKKELKKLQSQIKELHNEIYRKKIPVVIAYEGWDAAGKGGNIKRLAYPLDPRGFDVYPIASPEAHELARHYLWRFWNKLPKKGHVAVFDRSWYGRVMVERIEGYCTENDWQRAYNEINEFERELTNWGAVVMKFWLHIDSDTQLQRFEARQNTPSKQWKITDEDWRNREKWAAYETSVNEMLQKTSTPDAPWHIIESNDKYYARIKTLRIVKEALEKALGK